LLISTHRKHRGRGERIERIFFNFRETQEFFDISHETLYRLMKQGLPSHKIGVKRVFLKEDLIRWIMEHWHSRVVQKFIAETKAASLPAGQSAASARCWPKLNEVRVDAQRKTHSIMEWVYMLRRWETTTWRRP